MSSEIKAIASVRHITMNRLLRTSGRLREILSIYTISNLFAAEYPTRTNKRNESRTTWHNIRALPREGVGYSTLALPQSRATSAGFRVGAVTGCTKRRLG